MRAIPPEPSPESATAIPSDRLESFRVYRDFFEAQKEERAAHRKKCFALWLLKHCELWKKSNCASWKDYCEVALALSVEEADRFAEEENRSVRCEGQGKDFPIGQAFEMKREGIAWFGKGEK